MLKDVIDFIVARTGLSPEIALREINYAWEELWNVDDLPNSLFEISLTPESQTGLLTLPHYIGLLRGVKEHDSRMSVALQTPRPYYHDGTYEQSPWTWRVLGTTPLKRSILNASTISLAIAEAEEEQFTVTLQGPTDNASKSLETIVFEPGETAKESTNRFTTLTSRTKSALTKANVTLTGPNGEDYGFIPNDAYDAVYTIVQIMDRCACVCTTCNCFDILYKTPVPILTDEDTSIPYQQVLMTKTLEWILLPKEGQEAKADIFGQKARSLLESQVNSNSAVGKQLDLPLNPYVTRFYGDL